MAARYGLDTAWWRAYGNQALDKAVDLALERNVDLAKSALTAQKARYAARLRLSDLIPALSAEGSATSTRNLGEHDAGGERDMYESWAVQGSLNYELDLWQRLAAAHDAASWEYRGHAGRPGRRASGPDQQRGGKLVGNRLPGSGHATGGGQYCGLCAYSGHSPATLRPRPRRQ